MNEGLLSTIQFNKSHLKAFESLSHDKNPLHTDSQYASKTSFGHRVVYGIATLITALGKWSQGQYIPIQKALIQFSKPVLLDREYQLYANLKSANEYELTIKKGNTTYTKIKITLSSELELLNSEKGEICFTTEEDITLDPYQIDWKNINLLKENFELSHDQLPLNLTQFLIWSSYFVGMKYPGKQALYTQLSFSCSSSSSNDLFIKSIQHFEDLHSYSISGSGYGLDNFAIQALERPPLISYSTSTILKSIDKEFDLKGKNILITGGSRGLGSVLVKACLLKGANVLTTYKTSEDSIKAIKKEVGENGSHLVALRVDLIDEISVEHLNVWLKDQSIKLDYLICNAAPSIGQSRFDENQSFEFLKTFEAFYKIGLYSLKGSIEHFNEGCSILNISTDYINSPVTGFSHYISAKSAMESLFKGLNIEYPDYHFKSIRLPKMRTDQTNLGLDTSELPIPSEFLNKIFKTLTFN